MEPTEKEVIGTLDDAIAVAESAAALGADYKAIQYEKPMTPLQWLLGVKAKPANTGLLDPGQVKNGFVPRTRKPRTVSRATR